LGNSGLGFSYFDWDTFASIADEVDLSDSSSRQGSKNKKQPETLTVLNRMGGRVVEGGSLEMSDRVF
jgi:hypothetical protein